MHIIDVSLQMRPCSPGMAVECKVTVRAGQFVEQALVPIFKVVNLRGKKFNIHGAGLGGRRLGRSISHL